MNLKFSLRELFIVIAVISVACAALANAGIWWHSIIVTATLTGMTGLVIWGTIHRGSRTAFACGWLLFASAYLTTVFGPWLGENLGAKFITTKGLAQLESKSLAYNPSPAVLGSSGQVDFSGDLSVIVGSSLDLSNPYPTSTGFIDLSSLNRTENPTTFQSTGHWLLASVFGCCGARLAAWLFFLRQRASKTSSSEA